MKATPQSKEKNFKLFIMIIILAIWIPILSLGTLAYFNAHSTISTSTEKNETPISFLFSHSSSGIWDFASMEAYLPQVQTSSPIEIKQLSPKIFGEIYKLIVNNPIASRDEYAKAQASSQYFNKQQTLTLALTLNEDPLKKIKAHKAYHYIEFSNSLKDTFRVKLNNKNSLNELFIFSLI